MKTYWEVDDGTFAERVSAFQSAPIAIFNGCVDGLGVVIDTIALGTIGSDIAVELVAATSYRLLFRFSFNGSDTGGKS